MIDDDRQLPFSLDAERSVLGAVLISAAAWPRAASLLAGADFFRDAHRRIYEAMARLVAAGSTPADFTLLNEELHRVGDLMEVGGPAYVAALVDGLPHATNVEYYARIVRDKARLRSLISQSSRLTDAAYAAATTAGELVNGAVLDLLRLADTDGATSLLAVDAVRQYIEAMDQPSTDTERLPTAYVDFDELVGGVRVGELTIVAARPSVGKTSWALGAALGVARAKRTAAVFSLEMSIAALSERLIGWGARISPHRLSAKLLIDADYARISEAWTGLTDVPLRLEKLPPSLAQIAARCQMLQQDGGLSCIVIDYLQLLVPERRGRSREEEVSAISRGLKRLAEDRRLAVVAVSQLSRAPEGRADKRPHLADLRESGALEQDADLAVLLYRPEMHSSKDEDHGMAECIVAKNRNGPTGTVRLGWIEDRAQFVNLALGTS